MAAETAEDVSDSIGVKRIMKLKPNNSLVSNSVDVSVAEASQRIRDFCDDALYKSTFTIPYHTIHFDCVAWRLASLKLKSP